MTRWFFSRAIIIIGITDETGQLVLLVHSPKRMMRYISAMSTCAICQHFPTHLHVLFFFVATAVSQKLKNHNAQG
jgi:hypothetical protein